MIFTNTQKQSSFAAGAAILALSAITVKLIGVCYKIPLVHLLGAQGMGYFNAAYDVYALLCVISTTGLPIAVSVVINRYPSAQRKIYLLSLSLFAVFGCLGAAGVFFGADMISQ
ncbi:MAG: oligosaccharide flippase family protein, partial [Clostridia bacterium]|nr:oligosaccharide flippase family protein [Clostridia bacterium]